jgi:hypothetical protein
MKLRYVHKEPSTKSKGDIICLAISVYCACTCTNILNEETKAQKEYNLDFQQPTSQSRSSCLRLARPLCMTSIIVYLVVSRQQALERATYTGCLTLPSIQCSVLR